MAKYLSLSGLDHLWSIISPHLLPSVGTGNAKKVLRIKADGTGYNLDSLSDKEDTSNKVTAISASSTDSQYPSAKCIYNIVGDIETVLDAIINGT